MAQVAQSHAGRATQKDHLTSLPPEILQNIISYLLVEHNPDKAFMEEFHGFDPKHKGHSHTLDFLAASCKILRNETMDFAAHFLLQHSEITRFKLRNPSKPPNKRNFLRGRNGLCTFISRCCVFCGKKTVCTAILANGLNCCRFCDRAHWPDKITLTEALKHFRLTRNDLVPDRERRSDLVTSMQDPHAKFPRYGTFMSQRVLATMFLKRDIVGLAVKKNGRDRAIRVIKSRKKREDESTQARQE